MIDRLINMSQRWKFMLAPAIGIMMMMVLASFLMQFTREHDQLLVRLQDEDFVRAQTLTQLSNRMASNHAEIYELLRAAENKMDEGAFYDSGKPKLLEIHRIESSLETELEKDGLSYKEAEAFGFLLERIAEYRLHTANAMLTASNDLHQAKAVMSNSTKHYNLLNAAFLAVNETIQNRLNEQLNTHRETAERQTQRFGYIFAATIIIMLAISVLFSRVMSRDLQRLIGNLGTLVTRQKSRDTSAPEPGNEVATLSAAIDTVQESHAHLEKARDELNESNQRLQTSNTTILEREAALAVANQALEAKIAEQQQTMLERDKAEEGLRRAQRLEAVGQLTGGVAHDFNNLMSVMLVHSDLVRGLADGNPKILKSTDAISRAVDRGISLTTRLLAYSRKQSLAPVAANVAGLFDGLTDMLQRTLGETITLKVETAPDLWHALIDPHQFENALLNLAINARDAMPDGGTLVIETANVTLDQDYADRTDEVTPGDYVLVAVSDTGTGIPSAIQGKVFDPFFTTKDVGKGSGLGLSMVYGLAKQSGGHLSIYSEPGQGTTVKLYIPQSEIPAATPVPKPAVVSTVTPTARILVLEDNEDVRSVTVTVLRNQGYDIVEAGNGKEAIEQLKDGSPFDLLFTDVVLPGGINGIHVAEEAKRVQPDIRILFTTGYAENAVAHNGILTPDINLINKPYRRIELLAKIEAMLNAEP